MLLLLGVGIVCKTPTPTWYENRERAVRPRNLESKTPTLKSSVQVAGYGPAGLVPAGVEQLDIIPRGGYAFVRMVIGSIGNNLRRDDQPLIVHPGKDRKGARGRHQDTSVMLHPGHVFYGLLDSPACPASKARVHQC